jgi:hypothetical protein
VEVYIIDGCSCNYVSDSMIDINILSRRNVVGLVGRPDVMRKIFLWPGVNHNRQNDTQKSTLIPSMLYK